MPQHLFLRIKIHNMESQKKTIGLTKNSDWQFGIRKTFAYAQGYLWDFMLSEKGLKIWLGNLENELKIKKNYKTKSGIEGLVKVFIPYSHIRMSWKKKYCGNTSIVQVRVIGNHEKPTISLHQEKLLNNKQREEMKLTRANA